MSKRAILVIDLGSQTTTLIARRIRDLGVRSEVLPHTVTAKEIKEMDPFGIVLSGSPFSFDDQIYPKIKKEIFELGIPILGICYGLYLIVEFLNGVVEVSDQKEYGAMTMKARQRSKILFGLPETTKVWMNHGCKALSVPGVTIAASTKHCKFAAFETKHLYAVQFHPEVAHTQDGHKILSNFTFKICKAEKNWHLSTWANAAIEAIRKKIGSERALCAVSGGVDSTVAAALCSKAIDKNLFCVFVDTGLLRDQEGDEVEKVFSQFQLNFRRVNAQERFMTALKGITDPEEKRKIIGREYISVFEEEARKIGKISYLIQGTIYSDKIESSASSSLSHSIKSHHNVGGLPKNMKFALCEPLEFLFKDEVRKVGISLGLPKALMMRHPFPGPGLAIQIVGEVTAEKVGIVRAADKIAIEELKRAKLYEKVGEIFTNFVGIRTTGVKGDGRAYEWLVALRCVDQSDLMTSDWSRLPHALLATISSRITNEVPGVNRVVYDITTKPPATIRWE